MRLIKSIFGALLLTAALLCAAAAAGVAFLCQGRSPVNLDPLPDPEDTVRAFFDCICSGHYEEAYLYLENCDGLGLEKQPEDENAALFWEAVRNSMSWKPVSCSPEGTSASAVVELRCVDIPAAMAHLDEDVNERISARIENAARTDGIYAEDGSYQHDFVLLLYREAVEARLAEETLPSRTEQLEITLKYHDAAWHIVPDSALYAALSGGI